MNTYAYVFVKMMNILLIPNESVKRLNSDRIVSYTSPWVKLLENERWKLKELFSIDFR